MICWRPLPVSIVTSVTFSRRAMRHGASWGFLINIIVSSFEKIFHFHKKIWTDFFGQRFFRSTECRCRPLLFGRVYVYALSPLSSLTVLRRGWNPESVTANQIKIKRTKIVLRKMISFRRSFSPFWEVGSQSVRTFFSFIKQETIRKINEREQMKL